MSKTGSEVAAHDDEANAQREAPASALFALLVVIRVLGRGACSAAALQTIAGQGRRLSA